MKPPIPLNERARLELLRQYAVLDTAAEPAFDELTADAAALCGTPVSLLSFVDRDRQWCKSSARINIREVPREVSFCAHAICHSDLFVVPDALADQRFMRNPLVTGEHAVRFYAGMPLLSAEGLAVGTISVMDRAPRVLTDEQADGLRALAKSAIILLEIRRARGR